MGQSLFPFKEHTPTIGNSVFIAPGAKIIGNVTLGENSSVWYNAILRGDVDHITIGNHTNVQDNSVIHTSRHEGGSTIIGNNVTIGHMAIIHSCTIQDNAFIGMGAIVMDQVLIEEYGFVAAGALIPPGKVVKSKELWAGVPAKFIRYLTDEDLQEMVDNNQNYVNLAKINLEQD